MISHEAILHQHIADYLKLQHPGVIYRTDFAAGIKMTMGQAAKHKRLQSGRAYPDLFLAEPRWYDDTFTPGELYCGLYIEIKAEGVRLKNGNLPSTPHIKEQDAMLKLLEERGYKAVFAVGFDEAKDAIDKYLALPAYR